MGINSIGNETAKGAGLRTAKGFTLIASLLLLLLLSGMAIGLLMMVNTEGKVGATDLQNNLAFHAAEGGMEKMTSDLNSLFQNIAAPTPAEICGVGGPNTGGSAANEPSIPGVTWMDYSVMPGSAQSTTCPTSLTATWGTITGSGQNAGLHAQIIPVNLLATAAMVGGQEVSMSSQAQVALIPVFQFGIFSEGDLLFENGGNVDEAGEVHTNADLYPFSAGGILTFHEKISAWGNVIRTQLPNGIAATTNYFNPVYIPSANGDCAAPGVSVTGACTQMSEPTSPAGPNYGDGSVTGAGSTTAQSSSSYNTSVWNTFSQNTTNGMIINGNYGSTTVPGTGAKLLSMSFVGGGTQPYEILRRPPSGESASSAVGQSREYNLAQIRVLLSDDPTEFQNGTGWSDPQNVRLANLTSAEATLQGGNATATNPFGITIASGNYASTFGSPTSGNTFNLYFAAASNAVPIPAGCPTANTTSTAVCPTPDWPYAPKVWTSGSSTQGLQPTTLAPIYLNNAASATTIPTINLCPPSNVAAANRPAICPLAPTYPYYAFPNANTPLVSGALNAYNSANSNAWSLIDGYLRVEYLNNSGQWVPVTNEWLSLGFARGSTAPTAPGPSGAGSNPINPNAILLLQQPADRLTAAPSNLTSSSVPGTPAISGASAPSVATAPSCKTTVSGVCTLWTPGVPPSLASDSGSGGQWAFGLTPTTATTASTTVPQSLTQYNWYPINFYDPREGEVREQSWTLGNQASSTDTTCTTNGMMNAVEIDVGNLKRWLGGNISGTSGGSVNSSAENGYVLYFSDRRGMLPNPNGASVQPANTKTGDSGLEDVINANGSGDSATGTPDGRLEPVPTGRTYSPEDVNENGALDNWGAANLGLGFWGTGNSSSQNLNTLINSGTYPDPYGTLGTGSAGYTSNRIANCGTTGRKNWVSGARHVLKLVDGSLGNVPLLSTPVTITSNGSTTSYWGGFTVASENPVYIQGDYNSNSSDTTWTTGADATGMAAASVIADAVSVLSDNWDDRRTTLGISGNTSPTYAINRITSPNSYYRVAIVAGKNMNFPSPSWVNTVIYDAGIDGGLGNFLRLLEDWTTSTSGSKATLNYKGSLVSLYYATYGTGIFKCGSCWEVYSNPDRNFSFDSDFTSPYGLPPGTPQFHDVEILNYRQILTPRTQ
jgi:hypothetical protein